MEQDYTVYVDIISSGMNKANCSLSEKQRTLLAGSLGMILLGINKELDEAKQGA